jgi:hypothetical protein
MLHFTQKEKGATDDSICPAASISKFSVLGAMVVGKEKYVAPAKYYQYSSEKFGIIEVVPAPFWKHAKSKPVTEAFQADVNTFIIPSTSGNADDMYIIKRYFAPLQKVFRWSCTCRDFTDRREHSEHPYCKHIHYIYTNHVPGEFMQNEWMNYPNPERAMRAVSEMPEEFQEECRDYITHATNPF